MSYQDLIQRQYALSTKLQELQARLLESQIRERELLLDLYAYRIKALELSLTNPLPKYLVGTPSFTSD